jgi:hypothetical protein
MRRSSSRAIRICAALLTPCPAARDALLPPPPVSARWGLGVSSCVERSCGWQRRSLAALATATASMTSEFAALRAGRRVSATGRRVSAMSFGATRTMRLPRRKRPRACAPSTWRQPTPTGHRRLPALVTYLRGLSLLAAGRPHSFLAHGRASRPPQAMTRARADDSRTDEAGAAVDSPSARSPATGDPCFHDMAMARTSAARSSRSSAAR